jgi:hypothetical protein
LQMYGVPNNDLERLHWNYGNGRGAAGYRHVPSGITVARECLPDIPVRYVYDEVLADLERELRKQGLLPNSDGSVNGTGPEASPGRGGI